MLTQEQYESQQLAGANFEKLIDTVATITPSQWAEQNRYLSASVTRIPGYYSFDIAPYLREIVDCFSPASPVREVSVMKGVQIGFTVGVLENIVGYSIGHIKSAPMMFLTADADLAKLRMETYIVPMIQQSGLEHLIASSDEKNARKTGRTEKRIEWVGGGFLTPFGAQSANKLRSTSIQILLEDEIDGYPDKVGKDGDPCKLAEDRTAAYEQSRKILRGSTPLILETSKIKPFYDSGDKRKYMVPCKHCGKHQELTWKGVTDDGEVYGIVWDMDDDGLLVPGSVRFLCRYCQGAHTNDDKAWMFRDGGKHCYWEPSKKSDIPYTRSYYLPAFYSPVGMQTWETQVRKWLDAWNVETNKPKDMNKLQQFYNNVLGRPFKSYGEGVKFEKVITLRRPQQHTGEILNSVVEKETGGKIQIVTCAVDVHKEHFW
jgi:phage terminase large subunit GpA-like protein